MDAESGEDEKMTWQVYNEVNWDRAGEADEMNLEVGSEDEMIHN